MRYIIGIDGGGTKTEIVVCKDNGNIVARKVVGSSNPNDIGNDGMIEVVLGLIESVLPSDCKRADIGLGISGIFAAGSQNLLREKIKEKYSCFENVEIYSDKDSALNCAHDGDGCIVIMGTGSVGCVRKNGKIYDIGGGGYLVDGGLSGYDLGKEVIRAVLQSDDERGKKTVLTELFYERTKEKIREHLKEIYKQGKAYIATFAPLAFEALKRGDIVAEEILKKLIAEFENLVWAIYKRWDEKSCKITLFGGLTKQFTAIKGLLSEKIKEKIVFELPEYPILYGLIKGFNVMQKEAFSSNFKSSYNAFAKGNYALGV